MPTLDTVLHSTMERSRKKLMLASFQSNAFMAWAFANNRIEIEKGGRKITNPLITGRNPNGTTYSYYEDVPVAQTDEFDTVEYTWSRYAHTVIISDQEEDENRGDEVIFKILRGKMIAMEESIKENFSSYLYGAGVGDDPLGLSALIPDDPTTGTLGGIDRATETQWRTSSYQFAGALTATNIEEAMDDIGMDLSQKGDKPSLILAGRNIYRLYRAAARDKVMIPLTELKNGKRMFDLGFGGATHNNVPILYDETCPVNKMYFINDKYLRLHVLGHVNMKVKKLVAPWNVDAVGRRTVWQGQFCLWNAHRKHAVVDNAA